MRFLIVCIALILLGGRLPAQDSVWQSYYDAGYKAFEEKKWDDAAKFYKLAVKEGDKQSLTNVSMAAAVQNTAAALSNAAKYEEALPFAVRSAEMYRDLVKGYTDDKIRSSKLLATCYAQTKKHEQAIPFYEWTITAIEESGLQADMLPFLNYSLGMSQSDTGELKGAEQSLRKSRKLYAAKDKLSDEGDCLYALGTLEVKRKDDAAALDWFEEAATAFAKVAKDEKNGIHWLVNSYEQMIAIRVGQKKPVEVARLRKKLDGALGELGPSGRKALAKCRYDNAGAEREAGKLTEAEGSIRAAIELYDRIAEESEYHAYSYVLLGQLLAQGKKTEPARRAFADAVRIAAEFKIPNTAPAEWIHNRFGDFEYGVKDYLLAREQYELALALAEKKPAKDGANLIGPLADLIPTYGELKLWKEAVSAGERQIELVEKAKGDDTVDLISPLQQLAWVREQMQETPAAEKLLKRALAIREKTGKPGDAAVFASVRRLAGLYQRDKRPEAAESLYRTTVVDWEKKLGADSVALTTALSGLASFLADTGKHDEAEKLYRRAVANSEKANGGEHRSVAEALDVLALFLHNLGRQSEAEPLYKRTLKIFETTDGARSKAVAATVDGLAWICIRQSRIDDGLPLAKRALSIAEEIGDSPLSMAKKYNTLGVLLKNLQRYDEAEPLLKKALKLYESNETEKNNTGTAVALHNLGLLFSETDRPEEAEAFYRRAIYMKEKVGIDTVEDINTKLNRAGNLARSHSALASLLSGLGIKKEAEDEAKKALEIREKHLGSEFTEVIDSLIQLGNLAAARGNYSEREALYTRAAALRKKLYATDGDIKLASNHAEAAVLHRYHGRLDDADTAMRKALAMYTKHFDGNPDQLVGSWQHMAAFLAGQAKYEEAHKLLAKVLAYYEKSFTGTCDHASAMLAMANYELSVGDFSSAAKREAAAAKIYIAVYGAESRALRSLKNRAAEADIRAGNYSSARDKFEKLLADAEKDDPKSPATLSAISDSAELDILEGKYSEALAKIDTALALAEKFHGKDVYFQGDLLSTRSDALFRHKKFADAEVAARSVHEAYSKRLGAEHPASAGAALQLGRILAAAGKTADAQKLIASAKKLRDALYPKGHPAHSITKQIEAELALALGRAEESVELYSQSLKLRDEKYPADHPETKALLGDYLKALEKAGTSGDVKTIRARLGGGK